MKTLKRYYKKTLYDANQSNHYKNRQRVRDWPPEEIFCRLSHETRRTF